MVRAHFWHRLNERPSALDLSALRHRSGRVGPATLTLAGDAPVLESRDPRRARQVHCVERFDLEARLFEQPRHVTIDVAAARENLPNWVHAILPLAYVFIRGGAVL